MLLSKTASDYEAYSECSGDGPQGSEMATPVRYDLSLTHGAQVPQLYVFMLTVLSGLLAVFVVLVLHYNCMVNFRRKVPYRIFSCCENSPCEVYFPYTIDSK